MFQLFQHPVYNASPLRYWRMMLPRVEKWRRCLVVAMWTVTTHLRRLQTQWNVMSAWRCMYSSPCLQALVWWILFVAFLLRFWTNYVSARWSLDADAHSAHDFEVFLNPFLSPPNWYWRRLWCPDSSLGQISVSGADLGNPWGIFFILHTHIS